MAPGGKQTVWDQRVGLGSNIRWHGEAPDGAWVAMRPSTLARIDPRTDAVTILSESSGLRAERIFRGTFDHMPSAVLFTA